MFSVIYKFRHKKLPRLPTSGWFRPAFFCRPDFLLFLRAETDCPMPSKQKMSFELHVANVTLCGVVDSDKPTILACFSASSCW